MKNIYARTASALAAGLLSVFLSGGCSKTESAEAPPVIDPELVEIHLSGGIALSVQSEGKISATLPPATRAIINPGYTQDLEVDFARLDQKTDGSYESYDTAAALPATRAGNVASGPDATAISFGTSQYYLSRETNNNTKLVGWYPRAAVSGGVVALPIDGVSDIMLTQELTGNKSADNRIGEGDKVFTFKHQLTQLKVWAYAADAAARDNWGTVPANGIELKDQFPTCRITLPSTVAFNGTLADLTLPAKKAADDAAITYPLTLPVAGADATNAAECGYAMVAPVLAAEFGGALTLHVTTSLGGACDVPLTLPAAGFEKGTAYNIVLKFTATQIMPEATISKWEDADEDIVVTL